MTENIDIEWSDVDRICLENLGFTVSESFAVADFSSFRVVLRAKELEIQSELKTLSGNRLCGSSGPTVLEALWNLQEEWMKMVDAFRNIDDDLSDLCSDAESQYTGDEP